MHSRSGNDDDAQSEKSIDFFRGPETIAERLTDALHEPKDIDKRYSTDGWNTVTGLAWRPAWSIRSRRGSLRPLLEWWRARK